MNKFRYTPTDEEIRSTYGELLVEFQRNDIIDTQYHEDIALLMAHVNKLLSQENTDNSDYLNLEKWKITLDTIKLKAGLIKEQRLERERREKAEERHMKLNSIPIEQFKNAIASVITILAKYVPDEKMSNVMQDLGEVITTCYAGSNQSQS